MVWGRSQTHSFARGYPVVPAPFVQETFFLYWIVLVPLLKSSLLYIYGLFLDSKFYSTDVYVYPCSSSTQCWISLALQQVLKLGSVSLSNLFFLFKIILAIFGPLNFHMNFRINLLISVPKETGILIGKVLNL